MIRTSTPSLSKPFGISGSFEKPISSGSISVNSPVFWFRKWWWCDTLVSKIVTSPCWSICFKRPTLTNLETGVKTTYEGAIVERIPTRVGATFEKGDDKKIFIDEETRNVFTVGPDLKSITILY